MSRTMAELKISPKAFDEIKEKLIKAGYSHATYPRGSDGEGLDMHGIGLVRGESEVQMVTNPK